MAIDKNDYLALVTSEYQSSTNFLDWLSRLFTPIQDCSTLLEILDHELDLDYAYGAQLDIVGELVGLSRRLNVLVYTSDVGLTWDDTYLGWDVGVWTEGVHEAVLYLDDDTYRLALKVKVANNMWNGSIPDAYTCFESLFGAETTVAIQNNCDMSMELIFYSTKSLLYLSFLFINEYISFRPAGVKCNVHLNDSEVPYFTWDIEETIFKGWDEGYWSDGGYLYVSGVTEGEDYLRGAEGGVLHDTDGYELEPL